MKDIKKKEDKVIIEDVIHALRLNKKSFSKELKYKSHMSIYYVADGTNRLSEDMINRIMIRFPEVNYLFLKTGQGNPIASKEERKNQENIFNIEQNKKTPFQDFVDLPERIKSMEQKMDQMLELIKKLSK